MTAPGKADVILVHAHSQFGGIAEHCHYQSQELARRGFDVVAVTNFDQLRRPSSPLYRRIAVNRIDKQGGILAKAKRAMGGVISRWALAAHAIRLSPRFILLDSAFEYRALLWSWPHIALRAMGFVYLANLHDPVRVRLWGPAWLHRLSVRLMYAMLDGGLVHGPVPDAAGVPPRLRLRDAPLGYFEDLADQPPVDDVRIRLGIPVEAKLVLAFGHVVDRKNLDLLIESVATRPDVHLLVAGTCPSSTQKPVSFYRDLARARGVSARVHFDESFVPDVAIPSYFQATDIVALTYRGDFVSQSGVLQHAAAFARPVLVSCGPGPLRETMERFALGELVEPDSVSAIAAGLSRLVVNPQDRSAAFAAYGRTASWAANVDSLLELEAEVRARKTLPPAPPPA